MFGLSLPEQKRVFLGLGVAFTILLYVVFSNFDIAKTLLQENISKYQSGNMLQENNSKYQSGNMLQENTSKYQSGNFSQRFNRPTLWSRRIVKENGCLAFKGGQTLRDGVLQNIKLSDISYCKKQRFLVYKCDSSMYCGGWGDRQKGIISTFLMAVLTNRVFVIDMDKPCKLDNILLPNSYDWSLCYNFVKTVSKRNYIQLNYIDNLGKIKETLQSSDFSRTWPKQVVAVRVNSYAIDEVRKHKLATSRLKWLLNVTNEKAIHLVLHTLFKPGETILNDASEFYDKHVQGKQLVCSHIRMGRNPSIPSDAILKVSNGTMLLQFLKSFEKEVQNAIYVASDSEEIKQLARKNIKSYININRTIVHVDRLGKLKAIKSESCKGLATAILEQFILSLCDILLITQSGFGTMAAYMRGLDDNLFIFHPKTRTIVKSDLVNVQRAFKFH
ncbi:uncharacterized protein LOC132752886 isoform X2 [Ruditapes philippinarum]|uniref:uncharacterized protein LOC132752886 isoform X2 n=1 Tax=Ruditapes philippinarum TaxID=129788 RepID=UPI00295B2DE3|nr:uncharacterized protein LOC132752886 isoform X2 [Ruditapes philippinarum]